MEGTDTLRDAYGDVGAAILGALLLDPETRWNVPPRVDRPRDPSERRPPEVTVIDVPVIPPDAVLTALRMPRGAARRAYASVVEALRRDAGEGGVTTTPVTPRRYLFRVGSPLAQDGRQTHLIRDYFLDKTPGPT